MSSTCTRRAIFCVLGFVGLANENQCAVPPMSPASAKMSSNTQGKRMGLFGPPCGAPHWYFPALRLVHLVVGR
eukprot:10458001-Lingulodinium_polyedra.AAC.1